jgi:gamma-glutamyltranspeptidase/glutathione hydrolase
MQKTARRITLSLICVLWISQGLAATRQAAVAAPDRYGLEASAEILRAGGNAIDAAVATSFALAVTYPIAGNIGGGGFLVAHVNGESVFLDFREKAPMAAHRDMYLDENGEFVARRSVVGALAVGVPGTVKGMQLAHERFGVLPWARVLEPAIRMAREGFLVNPKLAHERDEAVGFFAGEVNFAEYFSGMNAGERFRQPELAATLQRIAADPEDFYRGKTAAMIVAQMEKSGGLITARDLADYTAVWREPLLAPWRGHTLVATPPPSSGGIALTQLLTIRDAASPHFHGVEHNSATYIHLLAEIEKRVFADRGDYLGDPDFGDIPVAELTDPDYLRRRALELNAEGMSAAESVKPGLESPDTTHFSIMDGDGNAVSLTYTLNWEFGSGVVAEGSGVILNDEMDDFSAKPGVPNKFGVIGGDMNAIEGGKRMLSSMSPTILLRDGKAVVVVGTPGGSTIFTSVFQVILNLMDYGMSADDAVAATRFHHQLPAARLIRFDGDRTIDARLRQRLEQYGYEVQANSWGTLGDVMLIVRTRDGRLEAAADPRRWGRDAVIELPARD